MLDKWFPLGSGVTPRGDDADLGVGAEAAGSEAQRPAVAPDRREDDVAVRAAVGGGVLECQAGLLWGQQKWGLVNLRFIIVIKSPHMQSVCSCLGQWSATYLSK